MRKKKKKLTPIYRMVRKKWPIRPVTKREESEKSEKSRKICREKVKGDEPEKE